MTSTGKNSKTLSKNVMVIFTIALIILIAISLFSYYLTVNNQHTSKQLVLNSQVQNAVSELRIQLVDAETGQRGFLITGREGYLAPYVIALQKIPALQSQICDVVQDNIEALSACQAVGGLSRQKLAELKKTIELRRNSGFTVAQAVVLTDVGNSLMSEIRLNLDKIAKNETDKSSVLLSNNENQNLFATWAIILGNILAILTLIAAMSVIGKNVARQESAQEELEQNNERFHLIAKAVGNTVWDWNIVDDTVWWNEGVEDTLGYARADIGKLSDWWVEHIHELDRERVVKEVQTVLASSAESWSDTYRFKKKDGKYAVIQDIGFILRLKKGKALRMISSMQDISVRSESEEEARKRTEELERVNKIMVGRELKMVELKQEIAELKKGR